MLPQLRGAPLVALSAETGRGLDRLMPAVVKAHADWSTKVKTRDLNDWLRLAVERHPPPAVERPAHQAQVHGPDQGAAADLRAVRQPRRPAAGQLPALPDQLDPPELRPAGYADPADREVERQSLCDERTGARAASGHAPPAGPRSRSRRPPSRRSQGQAGQRAGRTAAKPQVAGSKSKPGGAAFQLGTATSLGRPRSAAAASSTIIGPISAGSGRVSGSSPGKASARIRVRIGARVEQHGAHGRVLDLVGPAAHHRLQAGLGGRVGAPEGAGPRRRAGGQEDRPAGVGWRAAAAPASGSGGRSAVRLVATTWSQSRGSMCATGPEPAQHRGGVHQDVEPAVRG